MNNELIKYDRTCNICHETKPVSLFRQNKRSKTAFDAVCKECCRKKFAEHYQQDDKLKEYKRQYYLRKKQEQNMLIEFSAIKI